MVGSDQAEMAGVRIAQEMNLLVGGCFTRQP